MLGPELFKPYTDVAILIYPYLVGLLYALTTFLIGWLVAKGLQTVVISILRPTALDKTLEMIGFSGILKKGEVTRTPSELIGDLFYWVTLFVVFIAATGMLGIAAGKGLLLKIVSFTGKVVAAVVLLVIGIFVAMLMSSLVLIVAKNIELPNSRVVARITRYVIVIFAGIAALAELGIKISYTANLVTVVIAAIGLAFAIAFGMGAKDLAAHLLSGLFKEAK